MPKTNYEKLTEALRKALSLPGSPAMILQQKDLTAGQRVILEEFIRDQLGLDIMVTVEIVYDKQKRIAAVYIPARWERAG